MGWQFKWRGKPYPELEEALRDDLEGVYFEFGECKAEDMITHSYWLTDNMDGPCIHVWGTEGQDELNAEYHGETKWVTAGGERQ